MELTNFQRQFSRRIRNRRLELGLTIESIVESFNDLDPPRKIKAATWAGWECEAKNRREPRLMLFPFIAEVLELSEVRLILPRSADSVQKQKTNTFRMQNLEQGREILRQNNAKKSAKQ